MAKLKPRARLIRTIGDKLISGPEAAIIELVKNSYDADSPDVHITIVPPTHENPSDIDSKIIDHGTIKIEDHGHGMSYEDLEGIWLEPATDEKARKTTSRSGKRQVLGAKGVGRFAAARLGSYMTLTSVTEINGSLEKCSLDIDWEVFEKVKYLDDIEINLRKHPVSPEDSCGVRIEITEINSIWSQSQLTSLVQELRRLATPRSHEENNFDIILDLSAFKESQEKKDYSENLNSARQLGQITPKEFSPYDFNGNELLYESNKTLSDLVHEKRDTEGDKVLAASDESDKPYVTKMFPYSIGDHCHYQVAGSFDCNGSFQGTFNIVRGDNIDIPLEITAPDLKVGQASCGSFSIKLRLFDLERDSMKSFFSSMGLDYKKFTLNEARKFIADSTGIGISRNNFRIRPYGHHTADWLNLEKRRVQNPSRRLGHGQVYGSIDVSDEASSNLIERSSREGLEENGSFNRLKELVLTLLIQIEEIRFKFREKAGISRKPKKDFDKAFTLSSMQSISKAIDSAHSLSSDERETIQVEINKTSSELDNVLKGMKEYISLLESRTTLGNVVSELLHDGGGYLSSIGGVKEFFVDFGGSLISHGEKGELARADLPSEIETLNAGYSGLSELFRDLDPISGRKRGKPKRFLVADVVSRVEKLTKTSRKDADVFLEVNIQENTECFGHEGDLQAALMNLISNATYWLATVKQDEKFISIESECEDGLVKIYVSNNGPLINKANFDKLFDAGFTMKTRGKGLGLAIAKEAIINSRGTLFFDEESPSTTFVIEFPEKD